MPRWGHLTHDELKYRKVLDENEGWLWDHSDDSSLSEITKRSEVMRSRVEDICREYFAAVEVERKQVESELHEEALRAAAERAANGTVQ